MPPSTPLDIWSAPPAGPSSNESGPSGHCTFAAHTSCRACGSTDLYQYLDLGIQAPANALRARVDSSPEFTAPLSVAWCAACGLSQLEQVVDPKVLYADYPFRAGVSRLWQSHCAMLMTSLDAPGRKFLIDIGSNDGALLREATDRGWKVLGVDPTPIGDLPSLEALWSSGIARRIARFHGQADVVTATNVFGHVDDAEDFLEGISIILKPRGLAIIECPHIFPLLEQVAFDTIYHEHLSYWSLRPLELLAEQVGLKVIDVKMFSDLHGGTMRYVLTPGDQKTHVKTSVTGLRVLESAHFQQGLKPYRDFGETARSHVNRMRETLIAEDEAGARIWGYGANAKSAVLLQALNLPEGTVERIVDDTDAKHFKATPGTHIPIYGHENILSEPDILILFSWNNAADLKAKARERHFHGRFFLPHPEPHFEDT